MDGVDLLVRETDDPEVVVIEIEHHGRSVVLDAPYRLRALGVVRVRDGLIAPATTTPWIPSPWPGCWAARPTSPQRSRHRDWCSWP